MTVQVLCPKNVILFLYVCSSTTAYKFSVDTGFVEDDICGPRYYRCGEHSIQCYYKHLRCNGDQSCEGNEDEKDCPFEVSDTTIAVILIALVSVAFMPLFYYICKAFYYICKRLRVSLKIQVLPVSSPNSSTTDQTKYSVPQSTEIPSACESPYLDIEKCGRNYFHCGATLSGSGLSSPCTDQTHLD